MTCTYNFHITNTLISQLLSFVNISNKLSNLDIKEEDINIPLDQTFISHIERLTEVQKRIYINAKTNTFCTKGNVCIVDNNILIHEEWLTQHLTLFNYAIKKIIPRLINNISNLEHIFIFTLFTPITNIKSIILTHEVNKCMSIISSDKNDPLLKTLYSKLNHQIQQKEYNEWFANGNFYQYTNSILLLNINLTTGLINNKHYPHFKIWKIFISKLLIEVINNSNNELSIYCLGSYVKNFINKIKINFNKQCSIYEDVDPRLKNKPHDYLDKPSYFSDNKLLFNL